MNQDYSKKNPKSKEEFENYKNKAKKIIKQLIESGKLNEAKSTINEYEDIIKDDIEIYSIKAIIAIIEKRLNDAEKILKLGLTIKKDDSDLNYNLAYTYELKGIYTEAAIYYGYAEKYTYDENIKNELKQKYSENNILKTIKDIVANGVKRRFIVLSSCGWGDVLQRVHHISKSLKKFGNEVLYISPSVSVNSKNSNIKIDQVVKYVFDNIKNIDNIKIYNPLIILNNNKILFDSYAEIVQRLLDMPSSTSETVIITYMPYQTKIIKSLKGKFKLIYECVDDHTDSQYAFWGNKSDIVYEQELMNLSDYIITTSTSLYLQRISVENRKNVYLLRNAVNKLDFEFDNYNMPEDLKNIPEPRIVYSGAIYDWFNIKLFYDVVKSNPDKSFVILGFGKMNLFKEKYDNLYILGAKKHSELKKYLRYMQIGIIPFKDDTDIIMSCDPIKQYEYLACGLPVITTFMPESSIDKIYTLNANNKDDFNKAIQTCLNVRIDRKALDKFLIENSWNNRAALICKILNVDMYNQNKSSTLLKLENRLSKLIKFSEQPNFLVLYSLILNMKNKSLFLKYSEKAYKKSNSKYIERQYLYALKENNMYENFIQLAKKSKFIQPFLISELCYAAQSGNKKELETIMYACINNYKMFKHCIDNSNERLYLFEAFYYYIKDQYKLVDNLITQCPKRVKNNSPLYFYLKTWLADIKENKNDYKMYGEKYIKLENKYIDKSKHRKNIFTSININLNKDPFISIIIPTKNSADVLKYTLQTCINQKYDNYEIIVSDNSSPGNEATRKLIDEFNCPKIKYYRTPKEFAMIENYDFAYEKANGEYMMIIGSDDGLLLHCLEILPNIIKIFKRPLSITWDPAAYGWPSVILNNIRNGLFIPYPTQKNNINCSYYDKKVLRGVLDFQCKYSVLPLFYSQSIIKRDLAEEAKKITGNLFYVSPPDVYTGIVFSYIQKKYLHLSLPMTIGGSSSKSIGISSDNNNFKDQNLMFELKKIKEMNMYGPKYNAPSFAGEESSVLITSILAKNKFCPYSSEFDVDRKKFYKACTKYLYKGDLFEQRKNELYNCIINFGDKSIINWYEDNFFYNKNFCGYNDPGLNPLIPKYKANGGLIIDASKFGVSDIFGAAKLYRNIVGY